MNGNEDMTETVYLYPIRDTFVSIKTYPLLALIIQLGVVTGSATCG